MKARYFCAACERHGDWFDTSEDRCDAAVRRRWEAHRARCAKAKAAEQVTA